MTAARRADRLEDHDLLRRSGRGDDVAFATLVARHGRMAFGVARRVLGDERLAEDVLQDAFLAAWLASASYRPAVGSVEAWLAGIVRHRSLDTLRRQQARPPMARGGEPPHDDRVGLPLEEVVVGRERTAALRAAIDTLPEPQRIALWLVHLLGLSEREVAVLLGVPSTTVRGRVRTGLAGLAGRIEGAPAPVAPPAVPRLRRLARGHRGRRAAGGGAREDVAWRPCT